MPLPNHLGVILQSQPIPVNGMVSVSALAGQVPWQHASIGAMDQKHRLPFGKLTV